MRKIFILLFGCFMLVAAEAQEQWVKKIKKPYIYLQSNDSIFIEALQDTGYQFFCLVFHAEQDTIGLDPGLSTDGRWRAINLLNLLRDIKPTSFYTTPFRVNILTIQPVCDYFNIAHKYYDQADLKSLMNNIDGVGNGSLVMVVHPETFDIIFYELTGQKMQEKFTNKLHDKIIFIQRKKNQIAKFWTLRYNIR